MNYKDINNLKPFPVRPDECAISRASACISKRLGDIFQNAEISSSVINDAAECLEVWDGEQKIYSAIVLVAHDLVHNFLLVDKRLLEIYKAYEQAGNCDVVVCDMERMHAYAFGSKLIETEGYNFDGINLIFDMHFAKDVADI